MPVRIERKKPRILSLPFLAATSPSKNYVFNLLYTFIQEQRPNRSLDAGTGELRNRWMFPGEYFGITVENEGYYRGLELAKAHFIQQTGPTTVYLMYLEDDFSFLAPMDLTVCTHTISYVRNRPDAIARLAGVVRLGGAMFLSNSIIHPGTAADAAPADCLAEAIAVLEPLFDDLEVVFCAAEGFEADLKDTPDQVRGLTTLEMNMPNTREEHTEFCIMARGKKVPPRPQAPMPPLINDRGLMIVDPSLVGAFP